MRGWIRLSAHQTFPDYSVELVRIDAVFLAEVKALGFRFPVGGIVRRLRDHVVGFHCVLVQQGQAGIEQDQGREGAEGPARLRGVEGFGHRRQSGIVHAETIRTENFSDGAQHVRRRIVRRGNGSMLHVRANDEGGAAKTPRSEHLAGSTFGVVVGTALAVVDDLALLVEIGGASGGRPLPAFHAGAAGIVEVVEIHEVGSHSVEIRGNERGELRQRGIAVANGRSPRIWS